MITDEMICELWSWSATREAEQTATMQQHAFAYKLIALAQEVRPLPFTKEQGVYFLNTDFGQYHVSHSGGDWKWYALFMNNNFPYERTSYQGFETETEAIAAAQADFNRRVISNLLHGVADEN